jgi:hypothetical protein
MTLVVGDLEHMIKPVFEIDSYKSKMGDDSDISVLSFTVMEKAPAQDLVNFIERGYNFVLDADFTSGEQHDGMYRVFVEIERTKQLPNNVMDLVDGLIRLTNDQKFRFRYYKSFKSYPVDIENLTEIVPLNKSDYTMLVNENNMNNFKNFFNKSYLETIEMDDDELMIKKAYADPVLFTVKEFGDTTSVLESINENINMNDFAEIIFFTKYIGDYNVTKFGKRTLTFENSGKILVVERIV